MRLRLILISCAVSLMADAQSSTFPPQTLVYQNGFPSQNFQFQTWLDLMGPVRFSVTTPFSPVPSTINIDPDALGCPGNYCSSLGTIYAPTTPLIPNEPWVGPDYHGFAYEMMHQSLPPTVLNTNDFGFIEGLAGGKTDLIYATLRKTSPSLFPTNQIQPTMTCGPAVDMWNNRKLVVYGGATNADGTSNFYANLDNGFDGICALVDHLTEKLGGTFQQFDAAVNATLPTQRSDFLAIADSFGITIDGVKASTFLHEDVTNFAGNKDGVYFGIRSSGGATSGPYLVIAGNVKAFNPGGYYQMLATFANGIPTWTDGTFTWTLADATGTQIVTRTGSIKNPLAATFGWDPTLDPKQTGLWYQNYPTGAYRITACVSDTTGTCTAPNDPNMNDSDVFAVVNEDLSPGDVAVIVNGPHWGDLTTDRTLTLVSPAANTVTIEQHPGLVIFRNLPQHPDGSFPDITVTDGMYIRTFTPDRWAPSARSFKRRDEPILNAITRTTDYASVTSVAPGTLVALWGWNFTANDPASATAFPIPMHGLPGTATNDQGRTVVTFTTAIGAQFNAPILYSGFSQINIAVPNELASYLGETVSAVVSVNGTASQPLPLTVIAQDPGIYTIDAQGSAAAVFAFGPKTGQLVTDSNPVAAGDIVSIFGTGFGPKTTNTPDGMPDVGVNPTQAIVLVTVGGQPAVTQYTGSAPGFVGLDQINVVIPANVAGISPVVLSSASYQSRAVMLAAGPN